MLCSWRPILRPLAAWEHPALGMRVQPFHFNPFNRNGHGWLAATMLELERVLVRLLFQVSPWGGMVEFLVCQLKMLEESHIQQEWTLLAIRRKRLETWRA